MKDKRVKPPYRLNSQGILSQVIFRHGIADDVTTLVA